MFVQIGKAANSKGHAAGLLKGMIQLTPSGPSGASRINQF